MRIARILVVCAVEVRIVNIEIGDCWIGDGWYYKSYPESNFLGFVFCGFRPFRLIDAIWIDVIGL